MRSYMQRVCLYFKSHYGIGFSIVLILGIVALVISNVSKTKTDKTLKIVGVVKADRKDLSQEVTLTAELQPFRKVMLYAKVSGYMTTINVDIGDQVNPGQTLATLDIPELKADLARNEAIYKMAELDFNRVNEVHIRRPGLLAQEDVDKAEAAFGVAKANLEHARTLQDYSVITAPFAGIITNRFVDEGALIQLGTTSSTQAMPVVEVAENTLLRLRFPVPESIVPQIKLGIPVSVKISATGEIIKGSIVRTTGKVDKSTRTMETEVDLDNSDLHLTPGMYAYVTIYLQKKNNVLALPVQAVDITSEPSIFLVNSNNEIEKRAVTLGLKTPYLVEITGGVKEGDLVVIGDRNGMTQKMKVEPKIMEASEFEKVS